MRAGKRIQKKTIRFRKRKLSSQRVALDFRKKQTTRQQIKIHTVFSFYESKSDKNLKICKRISDEKKIPQNYSK